MNADDIVIRLRQRMRRGLFATLRTMEEAADEIEKLREYTQSLKEDLAVQKKRYDFVLHHWIAERFISDQLYGDLVPFRNDDKTEYMLKYEESRRNGTIALFGSPE